MPEPNFAKLLQTSSATVAACSQAVLGPFFELVQLLQRAIRETHLFSLQAMLASRLRQTSSAEVKARGCNISWPSEQTSPLRRRFRATGNASCRAPLSSRAVAVSGLGQLRQTSITEVPDRGYAVLCFWRGTSPLRRRAGATGNAPFRTSRLSTVSVKGEKLTA